MCVPLSEHILSVSIMCAVHVYVCTCKYMYMYVHVSTCICTVHVYIHSTYYSICSHQYIHVLHSTQLVERSPSTQNVAGSNPARGSSFFSREKKELSSGVVVYFALSL